MFFICKYFIIAIGDAIRCIKLLFVTLWSATVTVVFQKYFCPFTSKSLLIKFNPSENTFPILLHDVLAVLENWWLANYCHRIKRSTDFQWNAKIHSKIERGTTSVYTNLKDIDGTINARSYNLEKRLKSL